MSSEADTLDRTAAFPINPQKMIAVKPFVIVESPFAGQFGRNIAYTRACVRDSILHGEAPFASHLLYTQTGILRDTVHGERELGMSTGWHIMLRADLVAVYTDLGISSGMERGTAAAMKAGKKIEYRELGIWDYRLSDSNFEPPINF